MDKKEKVKGPYDTLNEKNTKVGSKNKNSWALSTEKTPQQLRDEQSGLNIIKETTLS